MALRYDPRNLLLHVTPPLVSILGAASQLPQQWIVTYGLRSMAAEEEAVATHHSQTLHSEHLANALGESRAVDLSPLDRNGVVNFAPGREEHVYGMIAEQVMNAAKSLGFASGDIMWGGAEVGAWATGAVSHFRDWGHFQMNPAKFT